MHPELDENATLAIAAAGGAIWRWNVDDDAFWLSGAAHCLAMPPTGVLTKAGLLERVHPRDRRRVRRALQNAAAAGARVDIEFHMLDDEASPGLRMTGCGGADGGGRPQVCGVLMNAGPRPAPEQINDRLAAIVATSDDAIVAKTPDGIVTEWNRGAETIFGFAASEMIGHPIEILLPPDLALEESEILDRLKRGEQVVHFETRRRRKDGQIIDVSLTVSPLWDRAGRLVGASKIARDITAQKRATLVLAEREAHLQSVLDTVPDAMIVIDPRGLMQSFSITAERLFGYRQDEVSGRPFGILMPSPFRQQHDDRLARYLASGQRDIIAIGRLAVGLRKDGSTFPMELSVGEVRSAQRQFFTGFVRDLTERQQNQRRLQNLQAELIHVSRLSALGEMASTLAHELNQPLSAVANYLNGARRLLAGGDNTSIPMASEAMERAAQQALRAGQIIRRLREFVSHSDSEQRLEPVAKLIEEASTLALVGVTEIGVSVALELDPAAEFVFADRIQVQQVLLNLIRNAIESMQDTETRQLVISSRQIDPDTVQLSVVDTGSGIRPEIAGQLFQPFVSTKRLGMGVGLSISRTIVEAHGGRIWAEPNPGGGTIFRLTLRARLALHQPGELEAGDAT